MRRSCTSSSPTRRGHQAPAEVSALVELAGNRHVSLRTLVHYCFVVVFLILHLTGFLIDCKNSLAIAIIIM